MFNWRPYVPVAQRRAQAMREAAKMNKKGQTLAPVIVAGRVIAETFWGKAWCDNLERYSDYSNRLPRGRTYVRNGSVIDLQIAPGTVSALVSGSSIYKIGIKVATVQKNRWNAICNDCSGAIDSLVELLQGRFSKGVMARICHDKTGMFPAPADIAFECSCPDWASMCKHVAAVLYGIGARLDEKPELLFTLRSVNHFELIAKAGQGMPKTRKRPVSAKVLDAGDLSEMFGIEMTEAQPASSARRRTRAKAQSPKTSATKRSVRHRSRRAPIRSDVKS